jgi:hypothetical protein
MKDEVKKALSRPCSYTSEEKLDTDLFTSVVLGICAVVRGMDTRYISWKSMSMSWKLCYVGLVLDVGMRYMSDAGTKDSTSVGGRYERRYECER